MALALARYPHSMKAAEESFRQAIGLDPENFQCRIDLAKFFKGRGRLDAATRECEKILELSPNERRARSLLKEIERERHR